MSILILAVGKMKGPEGLLCETYQKRLHPSINVKEVTGANQKDEVEKLMKAIPVKSFIVVCDERGKDLSSRELANKLSLWQARAGAITFIIGGADGCTDALRERADYILSFGSKTWPHRLLRVMLIEQLYRAQQINSGHPYHRD